MKHIRDNFHAYLVKDAEYDGKFEIPVIENTENLVPKGLVLFPDAQKEKNHNQWIHFYTDDRRFESLWNNPTAYLGLLKKFDGVVSPDFSVHRDMPLAMQIWNTYRNHALAHWFTTKGLKVIPNIRWGDERSYEFCFNGIQRNGIVAVGTTGCIRKTKDRYYFKLGLAEMYKQLSPHTILVYGSAPDDIFLEYSRDGIQIVQYQNEMQKIHEKKTEVA